MAKKKLNNTFYNIDYYSMKNISKLPPDTIITGKLLFSSEENIDQFDYPNVEIFDQGGFNWSVRFPVQIREELKKYVRTLGMELKYDSYIYVHNEIPEGYLYSGWGTGRKTKIKPDDLPESFVYLGNYKKHGYLQTAGVTDIAYKPSPFHNHTFKDDFLYLSYHGEVILKGVWDNSVYDEYVFGNDIVDVIFSIEKWNPVLKDKVDIIKKQMVDQYNAYCDEMERFNFQTPKKIKELKDLLPKTEDSMPLA